MKNFFSAVYKSCYDMEFYRSVRSAPWPKALRYYAVFMALVTVITAIGLFAPDLHRLTRDLESYVRGQVPAETAVSLQGGVLTVSGVPLPLEIGASDDRLVIDTRFSGTERPTVEGYGEAAAAQLFIGRDAVFASGNVQSFKDFPELSFTRESFLTQLAAVRPVLVAGLTLIFALFFFVFVGLANAGYLLLLAWLAQLSVRLWGVRLSYGQWVATMFHAVTLPMFVLTGLAVFDFNIPYAFTFILIMFVIAVVTDERQQPITPPPPSA